MARRGGGSNSTVKQHQGSNAIQSSPTKVAIYIGAILVAVGIVSFFAFWFFSTPFGQKTMAVSATIFAFIYTYTYPLWWVLGKIWDQIKCVALWLWTFVFYPVGNFIYWVFT